MLKTHQLLHMVVSRTAFYSPAGVCTQWTGQFKWSNSWATLDLHQGYHLSVFIIGRSENKHVHRAQNVGVQKCTRCEYRSGYGCHEVNFLIAISAFHFCNASVEEIEHWSFQRQTGSDGGTTSACRTHTWEHSSSSSLWEMWIVVSSHLLKLCPGFIFMAPTTSHAEHISTDWKGKIAFADLQAAAQEISSHATPWNAPQAWNYTPTLSLWTDSKHDTCPQSHLSSGETPQSAFLYLFLTISASLSSISNL